MIALELAAGENGEHGSGRASHRLMTLDRLPGGYVMSERMRAFVAGEATYMTKLFYSVFSCNLYLSSDIQPDGSITVDEELNVSTTFEPSPRARFHVWFGLCYNWRYLNAAALARLRANFDILQKLTHALWPQLPACCQPVAIGNSNQTSNASMRCLMNGEADNLLDTSMKTAETLYIQSIAEEA
ncbi:hypothetical protein [Paraburkholderia adhaesiva]|uniref:hypothetical protein n=1 Tax=Paraburkholderia adhaesiva TaxID=2883244 RepID=UPI001F38F680|nr:hypothetical protein [Paraburkholderia adhaesiva]